MRLTRYPANHPPVWANDPIEKEPIMTEARSHLIRIPGGVRVLRTICGVACYLLAYDVPRGEPYCRVCGCTDIFGCAGGCAWADKKHTICTQCLEKELLP